MAGRPIRTDDINKTRQDVGVQVISTYLTGGKLSPQESEAAQNFITTLPDREISRLKFMSARANGTGPRADTAYDRLVETIIDANRASQFTGERFIDAFVASDPKLAVDIGPKELAVQQQQAYLKVLGFDIGKTGLDGIAGKDSKTQKALDEFAKKLGIDPNDKERVNQALSRAVMGMHQKSDLERMQKVVEAGKASPDDIKTLQWVMKGMGEKMPLSLRGDKMDGIAGPETKTSLKTMIDVSEDYAPKKGRLRDKFAPAVGDPSVPDMTRYTNLPDPRYRLVDIELEQLKPSQFDRTKPGYTDVLGGINATGIDLGKDFGKAGRGDNPSLASPQAGPDAAASFSDDVAMRKDRMQIAPATVGPK